MGFGYEITALQSATFKKPKCASNQFQPFFSHRKTRNRNGLYRCNSNPTGSFQIKDKPENGFGNMITELKAQLSNN